ncbi:MAG: cytochrome C oxidase Cbb3, partial [Planctomycetales bacterium]|nr:cytochrome C oxidase Cbb3 [Planctomycetales bacterium]
MDTQVANHSEQSDATDDTTNQRSPVLESFSYDDGIVRLFATATIVWALVGTLAGLIVALLLVMPSLTAGLPWLSFGRLRPLHTNAAIFA